MHIYIIQTAYSAFLVLDVFLTFFFLPFSSCPFFFALFFLPFHPESSLCAGRFSPLFSFPPSTSLPLLLLALSLSGDQRRQR